MVWVSPVLLSPVFAVTTLGLPFPSLLPLGQIVGAHTTVRLLALHAVAVTIAVLRALVGRAACRCRNRPSCRISPLVMRSRSSCRNSALLHARSAAAITLHCAARRGTAAIGRRRALLCSRRTCGSAAVATHWPCALASPVPAISAAAATEIKKRLVIYCLLTCLHCPHHNVRKRPMFRNIDGSADFVL